MLKELKETKIEEDMVIKSHQIENINKDWNYKKEWNGNARAEK